MPVPNDGVVVNAHWTPNDGRPDDYKQLWRIGGNVLIRLLWSKEPRSDLADKPGVYIIVPERLVQEA